MYYSAGTYESFAHPEKPKDVDKKSAYIIGTGLAGLTAAFYLVRDGQMKGEHIHLLEKLELAGGSCDGRKDVTKGFFMRGGREMDNHFEVMWDTFRDVPSIETPGVSVLDEYYWLNKHDPNYSLCRATVNCGEDAHTDKKFLLDKDSAMALSKLFLTQEKDLEDKKISDVLPESFWSTNFWLYWLTIDCPRKIPVIGAVLNGYDTAGRYLAGAWVTLAYIHNIPDNLLVGRGYGCAHPVGGIDIAAEDIRIPKLSMLGLSGDGLPHVPRFAATVVNHR